jgi:hypothetical protein
MAQRSITYFAAPLSSRNNLATAHAMYQLVDKQLGFGLYSYRIAKKYDLLKYIIDFSANGTFP